MEQKGGGKRNKQMGEAKERRKEREKGKGLIVRCMERTKI